MHYHIICPFKLKKSPSSAIFDEYNKRLSYKITLHSIKSKKGDNANQQKDYDKQALLPYIQHNTYIVLDEQGDNISSKGFADYMNYYQLEGVQNLYFIIGGADGLHPDIRTTAANIISFGKATWPHQLVVAMLSEQLYRAYSINNNGPYHRE